MLFWKKLLRDRKGFSLMEVLVAMIMIGIVGGAFSSIVFTSTKASINHKVTMEGLMIAQDLLEEIRTQRDQSGIEAWLDTEFSKTTDLWEVRKTRDNIYFYDIYIRVETISFSGSIQSDLQEVIIEARPDDGTNSVFLATRFRENL